MKGSVAKMDDDDDNENDVPTSDRRNDLDALQDLEDFARAFALEG